MSNRTHYPHYDGRSLPRMTVAQRAQDATRHNCMAVRDRQIALRVIVGWETLKEVAQDYGITSERVRQIVNRVDPNHQRVGRGTLAEPGSDHHPLRPKRWRGSKQWERGRARRLKVLKVVGALAEQRGGMPGMLEIRAAGVNQNVLQSAFSGVGRYRTAIRRLARLLGYTARLPGRYER